MALNILVVDDSRVQRRVVRRVLDICGLPLGHVAEAADGEEALRLVQGGDFGLVLLDVNMPRMNGLELLTALREATATRTLPVVMVSTEGSAVRIQRFADLGAAFVRKPFAPEELVDAIVDAIGGDCGAGPGQSVAPCSGPDF